jgi:DNA-binding PadR family transcriptional regulator
MQESVRADTGINSIMFEILLCLAGGDRHGYAIMQEVAKRTGGEIKLAPATLYRSIKKLEQMGYIDAKGESVVPEDPSNRRYYTLLEPGRRAAVRRAGTLAKSLEVAKTRNLLADSRVRS